MTDERMNLMARKLIGFALAADAFWVRASKAKSKTISPDGTAISHAGVLSKTGSNLNAKKRRCSIAKRNTALNRIRAACINITAPGPAGVVTNEVDYFRLVLPAVKHISHTFTDREVVLISAKPVQIFYAI